MNTSVKNTRSLYWDNIKGFLMLLVVFAIYPLQFSGGFHCYRLIVDCIYMFHMPAFVFVSGYFGKSERSCRFESIIRLVFLYFIFNSIMGFIFGFDSILQPMYSYWYLLALIAWRLTTRYIARFKEICSPTFISTVIQKSHRRKHCPALYICAVRRQFPRRSRLRDNERYRASQTAHHRRYRPRRSVRYRSRNKRRPLP